MDLKTLRAELQKLAALAEGWDASHEIVDIERDLALGKLRDIYDAVRFGLTPAAESPQTDDVQPADLPPVEIDLDLDAVMPLETEGEAFAAAAPVAEESVPEVPVSAEPAEVPAGSAVVPAEEPAEAIAAEDPAGEDSVTADAAGAGMPAEVFAEAAVPVELPEEEPVPVEIPVEEPASVEVSEEELASDEISEEEFTLIEISVEEPAPVGAEVPAGPAAVPAEEPAAAAVAETPAGEFPTPEAPVSEELSGEVPAPEERGAAVAPAPVAPAADAPVAEEAPAAADSPASDGISLSLFEVTPVDAKRAKHRVVLSLYGESEPAGAAAPAALAGVVGPVPAEPAGSAAGPVAAEPHAETHAAPLPSPVLPFSAPEAAAPAVEVPAMEPVATVVPAAEPAVVPVVSAAEPVAAMDAPSPVLGETLNADVTTVSDLIAVAAPAPVGQEPVTDLRRALCNNDRFLLARDLFGGDMKLCEQTIDRLNAFDDLDECMLYIAENFDWNPHCDGAKLLVDLIERKLV